MRRPARLLAVLAALLSAGASAAPSTEGARSSLELQPPAALAADDLRGEGWERQLLQAGRPLDGEGLMALGRSAFARGEHERALALYRRALAANASLALGREHDVALAHHYAREYSAAESLYRRARGAASASAAFHFDFGVTLERQGKILEAADEYNRALEIDPGLAEAWLNIAALHHLHGDIGESFSRYERAIALPTASAPLRLMAMTNVGVAYELAERVRSAKRWYARALALLPSVPFASEQEATASRLALLAHLGRAKRAAADWCGASAAFDELWYLVRTRMLSSGRPSALLPFDTLLYAMDPMDRKLVAAVHSRQFDARRSGAADCPSDRVRRLEDGRLHVGFLSYDFSDHPTSHLVEGVLALVDRSRAKVLALGYGRDDGSDSRRRVMAAADAFVNMAAASFDESAEMIRRERVHILMDAQGHTRGGRMRIAGLRPAPVIVNYLVYPGTSGAAFVDYIVSDALVTPPAELARAFSEKLVLLPNSYQANYYVSGNLPPRSELWDAAARALQAASGPSHGSEADIEPSAFVFVNFNKIDKVEATAFSVWMAILRRVPGSALLLLDPSRPGSSTETSEEAKTNVYREARALGICAGRIRFLPRVSKADHLRRLGVGDLFLDTLIYGAHSTATDALYAGVPVLTLAGDSFASRVGVSLLANSRTAELITHSLREYEDLAVYLATHPSVLAAIRRALRAPTAPALFRTREHTRSLEASWQAMFDLQSLTNRSWHIRLTGP